MTNMTCPVVGDRIVDCRNTGHFYLEPLAQELVFYTLIL